MVRYRLHVRSSPACHPRRLVAAWRTGHGGAREQSRGHKQRQRPGRLAAAQSGHGLGTTADRRFGAPAVVARRGRARRVLGGYAPCGNTRLRTPASGRLCAQPSSVLPHAKTAAVPQPALSSHPISETGESTAAGFLAGHVAVRPSTIWAVVAGAALLFVRSCSVTDETPRLCRDVSPSGQPGLTRPPVLSRANDAGRVSE
jgi:hypothetical protein